MRDYDDFALPSIENIEQMAKAYQKYKEEQEKNNKKLSGELLLALYKNIYKIYDIIECLYNKNRENISAEKLFNLGKRLKLKIDGLCVDYNFSASENFVKLDNIFLDIVKYCNNIFKISLDNFQNCIICDFLRDVVSILEIISDN